MNHDPSDLEIRGDELGRVDLDAAVAVVTGAVGMAFGPTGAILAAAVGPYAKHVIARATGLQEAIREAGLDEDAIVARLDENEALAQVVAEVVRGTVESDVVAKRTLLARAAIRAIEDDAVVRRRSKVRSGCCRC